MEANEKTEVGKQPEESGLGGEKTDEELGAIADRILEKIKAETGLE